MQLSPGSFLNQELPKPRLGKFEILIIFLIVQVFQNLKCYFEDHVKLYKFMFNFVKNVYS